MAYKEILDIELNTVQEEDVQMAIQFNHYNTYKTSKSTKPTVVSMFSGCGGFDLGLVKAGYDILWSNDIDKDCCITYKKNIGEIEYGDIRKIAVPDLPKVNLLVAGFPCQPFSNAGSRKGLDDDRGTLYEDTFRFIEKLNPDVVVYENVRGFLSFKNEQETGKLIDDIKATLEQRFGYKVVYRLVNFSHFGIPQNRIRVIVIAVKNEDYLPFVFPEVVTGRDLSIEATLKGLDNTITNQNELMKLNPQASHYGKMIPEGGSWKDIPYDLLPDRWKKIRDNMARYHYPKFFRRYSRNDVSGTITAAFKPENAAVWHPIEGRIFSVREIARIQTFPDDFIFEGANIKSKYKQIGNAVPPLFAELLGKQLLPIFQNINPKDLIRKHPESTEFNVNRQIHSL
jgi:DNA (cytosine-5)-methyltransferase 1